MREPTSTADTLTLGWLLRLRWAAGLGILLTLAGSAWGLDLELPWPELLAVLGLGALSNAAGHAALAQPPRWHRAAVIPLLVADNLLLTAVFYLTGGPHNPFSFLYLVHVALASVVLPPRAAWALGALSVVLFGLLFFDARPLMAMGHDLSHHDPAAHFKGMWVAFVVAAFFILTFVSRVTRSLAERERELAEARTAAARAERMASLATLAAGAAHELSTPLSTIALIAKELQGDLAEAGASAEALEDVQAIGSQVARCRAVLDALRTDAGDPSGEPPTHLTLDALLREALDGLPAARVQLACADATVHTYARSVSQVVRGLVRNGLDASAADEPVEVRADCTASHLQVTVRDHGHGMDPATLRRAGEPFFTTKPTGSGMGLGVFLARAVAERLGGTLQLDSTPGSGTTATLTLPRQAHP